MSEQDAVERLRAEVERWHRRYPAAQIRTIEDIDTLLQSLEASQQENERLLEEKGQIEKQLADIPGVTIGAQISVLRIWAEPEMQRRAEKARKAVFERKVDQQDAVERQCNQCGGAVPEEEWSEEYPYHDDGNSCIEFLMGHADELRSRLEACQQEVERLRDELQRIVTGLKDEPHPSGNPDDLNRLDNAVTWAVEVAEAALEEGTQDE